MKFLNEQSIKTKQHVTQLNEESKWDLGFEVAFYRDIEKKHPGFFDDNARLRRKFDLAMFSDGQIVVMEAKAQQGYDKKKDLDSVSKDQEILQDKFKDMDIVFVSICSSYYYHSKRREVPIEDYFDLIVTWDLLSNLYEKDEPIFERANCVYGK